MSILILSFLVRRSIKSNKRGTERFSADLKYRTTRLRRDFFFLFHKQIFVSILKEEEYMIPNDGSFFKPELSKDHPQRYSIRGRKRNLDTISYS